jgi:peptidoglycan/LPS O-acetylase OafA/YrhL
LTAVTIETAPYAMNTSTPAGTAAHPAALLAETRYRGLDGLRALAVLLVMAFHLLPGPVPGGYLGVDVFFVISGFLITGLLLRERDATGRIHLGRFWGRRARRLLPALALLLLTCCAAALALGGDRLLDLGRQVLGAATFSSNWLSIGAGSSYFSDGAPELFRNLWSLAVEEQFYLLWPVVVLLIALIRHRALRFWLLVVLAAASALAMALLYSPTVDPTRVYYGTDTHSFGLALGAALAVLTRSWPAPALSWSRAARFFAPALGWIAFAALLLLSLWMSDATPYPYLGGLALVSLLTAVAIAGAITPGSSLGAALELRPLRWIGERSYGLYLWHWPVWVLLTDATATLTGPALTGAAEAWVVGLAAAAVTFAAASLSYDFIEQPIRVHGFRATMRRWATPWRRGGRAVVTVAATLALLLGLGTASTLAVLNDPGQSELELQLAEAKVAIEQRAAEAAAQAAADAAANPTAPEQLASGDRITALGDSVMLAASPQLYEQFPGIIVDATVSRQMDAAPDLVQAYLSAGQLRDVVLLALGTNGPIDLGTLEQVRAIVGPDRMLVLVNVQAPRDWTDGVNQTIEAFAGRYRNVELANWQAAIAPSVGELAEDQIHPGGPITGGIYCDAVRDALQRLAELPPVRTEDDYRLFDQPV